MLKKAKAAKLPDGSNAFPEMQNWDGKARVNRMKRHNKNGHPELVHIKKHDRENLYMLAEGVKPKDLGVSQKLVDALAKHKVIGRYDVEQA